MNADLLNSLELDGPINVRDSMRMTWMLVVAAGGTARVPREIIDNWNPKTAYLEFTADPATGEYVFKAKQ